LQVAVAVAKPLQALAEQEALYTTGLFQLLPAQPTLLL